jgi:hypothetical protein
VLRQNDRLAWCRSSGKIRQRKSELRHSSAAGCAAQETILSARNIAGQ